METSSKTGRQSSAAESPKPAHVCQLCNKSYERADHLHRHLDSHRNERSFKCTECPRGFNRRDLLLRHQATHAKNAANGKSGPDRSGERAVKACDPCVISKLKCDNQRPCQRCKKRKVECKTDPLDRDRNKDRSGSTALSSEQSRVQSCSLPSPPETANNDANGAMPLGYPADLHAAMALSQVQGEHQWDLANMEMSMKAPTFFDQIMVPDFAASTSLNLPLDIFSHMPEQDWLSEDIDIFGLDFTPTIDEAFETSNMSLPLTTEAEAGMNRHDAPRQDRDESARQRHAIFQRSPWLWKPEANSHAFSEHRDLPLDESEIDLSASPHQPFLPALSMHIELSTQSRDRIFQMVLRAAKSHVSIPRFPSAKCLNLLLRVGLAKRMETDAWIHPYTIDVETARPELLTALIAAGCVCFGIPSVSKTGLILFEIVRVALNRLVEDDNSVIRDLQYLQACMIWIDITAFCGYTRKMEIAEHSLQPLVTALRRAGKFDRVAYTSKPAGDRSDTNVLENRWAIWAEQESYKRLVHHLFEHDMLTTITKVRNPLVSYAEMTLPLPACRELWLAPTAEAWNDALLENSTSDKKYSELSLRDLLADHELLGCLPATIDKSVARAAHLHGLAAETWCHFQQSSVVNSPFASTADPSAKLWLQTRHQKLYQMLQATRAASQDSSAVTALLNEFLMLSMHVNPDDVTRFAGKCGEAEAHRAYQELQAWSQTKRARTAIFHAGQVLRLGREVPPYQLRGADAFIIYHALMVLWAYGMMQRDLARRTRSNTPVGNTTAPRDNGIPVFLDEEKDGAMDAFLLLCTGRPCLRIRQAGIRQLQCCDLQHPQVVMQVGVQVLEDNYPNELRKNLPQLIKSLCQLMGELGALT